MTASPADCICHRPSAGVQFRDITSLLCSPRVLLGGSARLRAAGLPRFTLVNFAWH